MNKLSYKGIAICVIGALIFFFKQTYVDSGSAESEAAAQSTRTSDATVNAYKRTDRTSTVNNAQKSEATDGISIRDQDISDSYKSDNDYSAVKQYTFKNNRLADQHYNKHGGEMGYSSFEDYLRGAQMTIARADMKGKQIDGDMQYLNTRTCDFVVVSPQGKIRTYFRPNDCVNYFKRQ